MTSPAPSTDEGTQFIPLSDDEETLWTVIEITAEKPKLYKVRWEGNDPATGRPWAQSWVPKTDCTDDLRDAWKKKKAKKKGREGKGKSRLSKVSTAAASSTMVSERKYSRSSTLAPATVSRPPESIATTRSKAAPKSTRTPKRRHKSIDTVPSDHSDEEIQPEAGPSRPRKRRKVETEVVVNMPPSPSEATQESYDVVKRKKFGKLARADVSEFEDEAWGAAIVKPVKQTTVEKANAPLTLDSGEDVDSEALHEILHMKIGPPRGVKKTEVAMKTKSSAMKPRSPSKRNVQSTPPSHLTFNSFKRGDAKPPPSRFRSPSVSLYGNDVPKTPRSRKQTAMAEDGSREDYDVEAALRYPESPEHDPLFYPDDEEDLVNDNERPPSHPPQNRETPNQDDLDMSRRQPLPDAQLEEALSPDVPETQSQDLLGAHDSPGCHKVDTLSHRSSTNPDAGPSSSKRPTKPTTRHSKDKALGSIPRVWPSAFQPYHRSSSPRLQTPEADNLEPEAPLSSIEDFSPEKSKSKIADSIRNWEENSQRDTTISDDDALKARGQEVIHETRQRHELEKTQILDARKPRRPLTDLMKAYPAEPEVGDEPEFEGDNTMEDLVVQEMENEFFDLNGGGEEVHLPIHMPQEEEESTQDIWREKQLLVEQLALLDAEAQRESNIEQLPPSDPSNQERADAVLPANEPAAIKDPRARSNPTLRAEGTLEELPATLSPPRLTPNELSRSQTEPLQTQSANLAHAMNLLHVKSEETAKLKAAELVIQAKLQDSEATVKLFRETIADLQSALGDAQSKLAEEQASWASERSALQESLAVAVQAQASTETDRDFFREQYGQASGFVGSIREENAELAKRVAIAEGQTKDGVNMVKALYVEQIKALQRDVAQATWRAELLLQQHRRTDDEIRRNAGEYPELLAKHQESREEVAMLNDMIDELRRDRKALKAKLRNKEKTMGEGIYPLTVQPFNGDSHASQVSDLLYRCEWRPGGDTNVCSDVFDTREDLERHMFSDKHLLGRVH